MRAIKAAIAAPFVLPAFFVGAGLVSNFLQKQGEAKRA